MILAAFEETANYRFDFSTSKNLASVPKDMQKGFVRLSLFSPRFLSVRIFFDWRETLYCLMFTYSHHCERNLCLPNQKEPEEQVKHKMDSQSAICKKSFLIVVNGRPVSELMGNYILCIFLT